MTSVTSSPKDDQQKPYYRDYPRYKLCIIWCIQYLKGLANLRFNRYMMVQVLPGVYGIVMTALILTLGFLTYIAFQSGFGYGLYFLLIIAPISFLVVASLLRAILEFYQVVFRISENLDELMGIQDTVNRLSNISDTVDQVVRVTRHVPFWGLLSGRKEEPTKGTPIQAQDAPNTSPPNTPVPNITPKK